LAGKPVGHFFVFVASLQTATNNRSPQNSSALVARGSARKSASPYHFFPLSSFVSFVVKGLFF
jgi:hypothetical protein